MKTYIVKLKCSTEEDKKRILDTLSLNRDAWNFCSKFLFKKKSLNIKELHKGCYKKIRKQIKNIPAQVVVRAINDALSTYRTIRSNKHKIDKPCERKKLAMRLDKNLYTLRHNGIKLTAVGGKRIEVQFQEYQKFKEMQIFKLCDPLIFERDGELWLACPFENLEIPCKNTKLIGVDLGIKRAFVTTEGLIGCRKEFNRKLRQLAHQKADLQRKNTKSARRKLKQLRRKHRNISKDFTHKCANAILNTSADIIAMEGLRSLKSKNKGRYMNRRLHQWASDELKTILEYKALAIGKRIITVQPAYTSQRDFRDIPNGKRQGCRYIATDGIIFDADWNASMNIAKLAYTIGVPPHIPISHVTMLDGQAVVNRPNDFRKGVNAGIGHQGFLQATV